jgi:hypothetical protein
MAGAASGALGVLTTKGDLVSVTATGDVERVPVGMPGQMLTANPASPTGLEWSTGAAGGGPSAHSMVYGANMGAGDTGKGFEAHGISNGGKIDMVNAIYRAQITAARAGTLFLAWSFQMAITEIKVQINKNGVLVGVPTSLFTQKGTLLLADVVAQGDLVAIIFHSIVAGSTPGQSIVELFPVST